jgi:anion-transporting  ArsA/GET3 family ATPase
MGDLASTIAGRSLVVCMGPGGVGKTTASAAFALAAAREGRRVAVVTVDPSRRLGQALGLDADAAEGGALVPVLTPGRDGARLDALLLDGGEVLDAIVVAYAASPEAARRILDSRIYRAMSERLAGALEYAAMARVLMLHEAGEHDLVVLDTPPTANAIDFLSAPSKIEELAENPAAKLVASGGRLGVKIVGLGGAVLLGALERIGGGEFLQQLAAFLRDFADVVREFRRRGADFDALMRSDSTGAVVVTAATPYAVREALAFTDELDDLGVGLDAVLLNRADPPRVELDETARRLLEERVADSATRDAIESAYADAIARGVAAQRAVDAFATKRPGVGVFPIARQPDPPGDLAALEAIGQALIGAPPSRPAR